MTQDEVLDEFRGANALLEGHFILSSGLHSPVFLQKMRVFQDPVRTERLCRALAEAIVDEFGEPDLIVSPAMGGIIPGYETARALGCQAIFVEREEGEFRLRRVLCSRPPFSPTRSTSLAPASTAVWESPCAPSTRAGARPGTGMSSPRSRA